MKKFQPVAEIRYVPLRWSYGVLFCHSSAQELFILLDVRLTMSTVVMGWTMNNLNLINFNYFIEMITKLNVCRK